MKYQLNNGVSLETIEENHILVTEDGDTAVLNDLAGEIVCLVMDGSDSNGITDHIAGEYADTDRYVIMSDVEELLSELASKNFLELC